MSRGDLGADDDFLDELRHADLSIGRRLHGACRGAALQYNVHYNITNSLIYTCELHAAIHAMKSDGYKQQDAKALHRVTLHDSFQASFSKPYS